MKENTTLEPKNGAALHPTQVVRQEGANASFLFIFDKAERITEDAKEVTFSTHPGSLLVKVKFNLRDMKFKGALAV